MIRPREEVVRWFQGLNDYIDREIAVHDEDEPDEIDGKAVVVDHLPGDKVRLIGADPTAWGFVTGIIVRTTGVLYCISWPVDHRADSQHFPFEIESAD